MAATILNSPRAVEMSVYVVRAFVKLRQVLASNTDLARDAPGNEVAADRVYRGYRQRAVEVESNCHARARERFADAIPQLPRSSLIKGEEDS